MQARAYVILEHQSTGDRRCRSARLSYQVRIWKPLPQGQSGRPAAADPRGAGQVMYAAAGSWHACSVSCSILRSWRHRRWLPWCRNAPLIIEDLAHRSNDDLRGRDAAGVSKAFRCGFLRDARDRQRLLDSFDSWIDTFAEAGAGTPMVVTRSPHC